MARADELSDYVGKCERDVGFSPDQVPWLNCNDGVLFKGGKPSDIGPENDFVGHVSVNPYVDLVFACRWLTFHKPAYSPTAVTIELLIHNRGTGETCFFEAKDTNPPGLDPEVFEPQVSTTIVSPTDPNASSYWMQPKDLDAKKFVVTVGGTTFTGNLRCVGCHVAGPYIASVDISPALQKFGLLNDGHDTFATRYHSVAPDSGAFFWWNLIIKNSNSTTGLAACANGCHSIGLKSTAGSLISSANHDIIVPSIQEDISTVNAFGVMPANNPTNQNIDNSYNWVNMSQFDWYGEYETLSTLQWQYPKFYCSNPVSVEAHVVDSDERIRTDEVPDKLTTFNLQDGLVCRNADQPGGRRCQNYQTRYMCNGKFTAFQNLDDPSGAGDWEPRNTFFSKYKGSCPNPTWMQARYQWNGVWVYVNAPADRLAEFDTGGLVCNNADQNNGQCSNYVVRFNCQ